QHAVFDPLDLDQAGRALADLRRTQFPDPLHDRAAADCRCRDHRRDRAGRLDPAAPGPERDVGITLNPPLDFEGRGTVRSMVEGPLRRSPAKAGEDLQAGATQLSSIILMIAEKSL